MIKTQSANNAPKTVINKYLDGVVAPTKDRKRIFRVLSIGQDDDGNAIIPQLIRCQGDFLIYDGMNSYYMVNGSRRGSDGEPIPERFRFQKDQGGMIICGEGDQATFALLMMHPLNASNPLRDANVTPVFELVDEAVEMKDYEDHADALMLALEILGKADADTLRNYHSYLGRDPNRSDEFISGGLKKTAIENPDLIIELSKDDTVDAVALIKNAVRKKLVRKDTKKRQFVDPSTGDVLHKVLPGKDMERSFALFLKGKPDLYKGYEKLLG